MVCFSTIQADVEDQERENFSHLLRFFYSFILLFDTLGKVLRFRMDVCLDQINKNDYREEFSRIFKE